MESSVRYKANCEVAATDRLWQDSDLGDTRRSLRSRRSADVTDESG
jgi:hypothetical protein